MTRYFAATPGRLFRARTDPVVRRWVGPRRMTTRIDPGTHVPAAVGGSVAVRDGTEYGFRSVFH